MKRKSAFLGGYFLILLAALFLPADISARVLPDYPSQQKLNFNSTPYTVKKGDSLFKLFKNRWEAVARFNRIDEKHLIVGMKIKVPNDLEAAKNYSPMPEFLGKAEKREKYVFVDLEEQFLGAYENGRLVFSAPISSANPNCLDESGKRKICYTPEAVFKTLGFHKDHISSIYKDAINGENIPMPYAVMFYLEETQKGKVAYWLHAGDLPGYPDSHGCVRLTLKDAQKLFLWLGGQDGKNGVVWKKNGPAIEIAKSPLLNGRQGDVKIIEIIEAETEKDLKVFLERGEFKKEILLFRKSGKYYGLLALDLAEKPGIYVISVYGNNGESVFRRKIFIDQGVFPKHISKSWNKREFSEEESRRIAEEKAEILKGYESVAEQALWLEGFEFPVEVTVKTGKITHPFGEIRINPVNKRRRFHRGVDVRAPQGFPIKAIAGGRVTHVGYDFLLEGNITIIDHGAGVFSAYLHQSKILVEKGDEIAKGQIIGEVGRTGNADGPHLHLSVRVKGAIVDPIKLIGIFN